MKNNFVTWAAAPPSWIVSPGYDKNGTVISSRVRLARNLHGYLYPQNATSPMQKKILDTVFASLKSSRVLKNGHAFPLNDLSALERHFLMERQLISREHTRSNGERGLFVMPGESLSIMVNEEDHVRAASFKPGLALEDAWEALSAWDDEFTSEVPVVFDDEFGFVTACPTNMGTGLRASCLLHLPAMTLTGKLSAVVQQLEKNGFSVRGFYGEGTSALGDLFQVSNAATMGRNESSILDQVEKAVNDVCQIESKEMETLTAKTRRRSLEDRLYRAWGTLKAARMLTYEEGMKLLSLSRLAVKLKLDIPMTLESAIKLCFLTQTAHLIVRDETGRNESGEEDLRAAYVRKTTGS